MAASPIIIESSSSPGLPSPSALVRPRAPILKSGSRLQQLPVNAKVGFATVASLCRDKVFEDEEARRDEEVPQHVRKTKARSTVRAGEEDVARKESSGKLARPKKTSQRDSRKGEPGVGSTANADLEASVYWVKPPSAVAVSDKPLDVYEVPATSLAPKTAPLCESIRSLSAVTLQESPANEAKKPGKAQKAGSKSRQAVEGAEAVAKKRSRKSTPKSKAIVLNSDESEPDLISVPIVARGSQVNDQSAFPTNIETTIPQKGKSKKTGTKTSEIPPERIDGLQDVPWNKDSAITSAALKDSANQSVYFKRPAISVAASRAVPSPEPSPKPLTAESEPAEVVALEKCVEDSPFYSAAPSRRRRSWTPAKDTTATSLPLSRPTTADSSADVSHTPRLQLTDILGSFGYVSVETAVCLRTERTITGEAATKRRRIDLAEPTNVGIPARNVSEASPLVVAKPVKRKKEPKKPQTITALATAAFQPVKESTPAQTAVQPVYEIDGTLMTDAQAAQIVEKQPSVKQKAPRKQPSVKQKAPQKRRSKVTSEGSRKATPKASKPTKSKPAFNEKDHLSKLYSPSRASAQLKRQDFLFGTSSQLAIDESAASIRDMQVAVRESERMPAISPARCFTDIPVSQIRSSQIVMSPQGKSCARVPTAPHGTYLSLEQAGRELWSVASRDSHGGMIHGEKGARHRGETAPGAIVEEQGALEALETEMRTELIPRQSLDTRIDESAISIHDVDLSPGEPAQDGDSFQGTAALPQLPEQESASIVEPNSRETKDVGLDRSVIDLCYSSPLQISNATVELADVDVQPHQPPFSGIDSTVNALFYPRDMLQDRGSASPLAFRYPLLPLDSNASILSSRTTHKMAVPSPSRAFSSVRSQHARTVRSPSGRDRSGKAVGVTTTLPTVSRRRDRSPKPIAPASDPSPHLPKIKQSKTNKSASQPTARSDFVDIDEILDSDSPSTPSPPRRRRAGYSPPVVQTLDLSPSEKPKAQINMKPDGPQWPSMRSLLFPKISHTIKAAPPSKDPNKLSWWQKILMYDPIIVEDLTAWLNDQGLRVDVKKQKVKKKVTKRKKGVNASIPRDESDDIKWEVHAENLQSWMVQKWCEEKSICCYTKDSGWRGKR